jgi:DNA invertase Pin-like site-specific DNA recombinase
MATIGYVYVGPVEHSAEFQRDLLRRRGAERIFEDVQTTVGGPKRPQLAAALEAAASGDTLLVWRLDRLGSTSTSVLSLLEVLSRREVGVSTIAERLDTGGPNGAVLQAAITAFNELERNLLRDRALVGVYAARARGRNAGRPRALSDTDVQRALALREQGASVREVAEELGTSRATIYRVLETRDEPVEERSVTISLPAARGRAAATDG